MADGEGWAWPSARGTRREHYFVGGTSLCGRHSAPTRLFSLELEPKYGGGYVCVECRRKADLRGRLKAIEQREMDGVEEA